MLLSGNSTWKLYLITFLQNEPILFCSRFLDSYVVAPTWKLAGSSDQYLIVILRKNHQTHNCLGLKSQTTPESYKKYQTVSLQWGSFQKVSLVHTPHQVPRRCLRRRLKVQAYPVVWRNGNISARCIRRSLSLTRPSSSNTSRLYVLLDFAIGNLGAAKVLQRAACPSFLYFLYTYIC